MAYKASGWRELGQTQGYGRCQQDYCVKHDQPKALWVKELKPNAWRSRVYPAPPLFEDWEPCRLPSPAR
jgi:hypothetical protein